MRHFRFLGSGLLALALLAGSAIAQTGTVTTIYEFAKSVGWNLGTSLLNDGSGGFYGVTGAGGSQGQGVAFHLTPNNDGSWSETTIHTFGFGADGQEPSAELVWGFAGDLWGTTWQGGQYGQGTVFRLTPNGDGSWSESVVHDFHGFPTDGSLLASALTTDSLGNFWGTTASGGSFNGGTIFELTPNSDGTWAETIFFNFNQHGFTGWSPRGKLAFDSHENLYGITDNGGKYNHGTAWEFFLLPEGGGSFVPLHQFGSGVDGADPFGGLIFDASGNIFGTTINGGKKGAGTVFELSPIAGGGWTYKTIVNFTQGENPMWTLLPDGAGGYYGTAPTFSAIGRGYVFHVTQTNGVWSSSKVSGVGSGLRPQGGVIWGSDGKLYGTTAEGGTKRAGTVYQVSF